MTKDTTETERQSKMILVADRREVHLLSFDGMVQGDLKPVFWRAPDDGLDFDSWSGIGRIFQQAARSVQWWVGDWLNYGEHAYGEKYAQALDELPYAYGTLANMAYVAKAWPPERRREDVSWSIHAELAALPPDEADRLIGLAARNGWTRQDVRDAIKAENDAEADGTEAEVLITCPSCKGKGKVPASDE